MAKTKIKLGVNIDHIATLRQVRGATTTYPDLLNLTLEAVKGGAEQITIHLREDRRHIQISDLILMSRECPVPLNLEMAATSSMIKYAKKYKPDWVCIVPENRHELTTEGGLNVSSMELELTRLVEKLQPLGIEISFFIEPSLNQVQKSFDIGADAIELHTGKWVRLTGAKKNKEWLRLCESAKLANQLGMRVHAGHGLDFNHAHLIKEMPHLQEVNIGHSLVCYGLEKGFRSAVKKMAQILR